jgi:sugar phosphate isomerase/epimerase
MKIAYFTVGLPESAPEQAVKQLKKYGYDGAEWRVTTELNTPPNAAFWKDNKCTLHNEWSDAQFKAVADMAKKEGFPCPVLGAYAAAKDIDLVKRMMEVANIFDAPMLRINFSKFDPTRNYNELFQEELDNYAKVVALAKKHKVKPLIEIHMGNITPSASAAYRFVSHFKPSEVGVIHDAGNMVYEGYEDYKNGIELLGPYLSHVHIKNSRSVSEPSKGPQSFVWKTEATPLWKGLVNFTALLGALKKAGYGGWLSVEDFSTEAGQEEKVKENIAFLRKVEASL